MKGGFNVFESKEVLERQNKFTDLLKKKYGDIPMEDFAKRIGVNNTIVRNFYYGGNVTMKTLDKIANGLGVKASELL